MKITRAKLKQLIKEEVDLFAFAIETPFSTSLPHDLAFHPMVQEKRRTITIQKLEQKYDKCKEIRERGGLSGFGSRPSEVGTGQIGRDLYDKKDQLEAERNKLKTKEAKIAALIRKNGSSEEYRQQLDDILDRLQEIDPEIQNLGGEWAQRIRQAGQKTKEEEQYLELGCSVILLHKDRLGGFEEKAAKAEKDFRRRHQSLYRKPLSPPPQAPPSTSVSDILSRVKNRRTTK
tara:strand:- start:40 stop:735 length:696 start_codon:yes stop_codon:yes gene_type:complete